MKKSHQLVLGLLGVAFISATVSAGVTHVLYNRSHNAESSWISNPQKNPSADDIAAGVFLNTASGLNNRASVGAAPNLTPAAESAVHSVVHIKVEGEQQVDRGYIDPFEFFFGRGGGFDRPSTRPVVGYGSGVIISQDGYIITNNHVVSGAKKISVTLNDNRTFTATLVGSDAAIDIALLKVEGKDLPTIPFGNSDALHLGEWVLAVGNPFNLTGTVTAGIVSAKARSTFSEQGGNKIGGFIQTDAAVNPGNSGGALVNAAGELVGINTMIYSQTGNYAGYSFAVPINNAAKAVADIKRYGVVQRAMLGVQGGDVTSEVKKEFDLKVDEGVVVTGFAERSGAYSAGLEEHDVIVAVEGQKIRSMAQLQDVISVRRPGDKIRVTVNRKGKEKTYTVTLKNEEGGENVISNDVKKNLGVTFKELTREQKRSYGVSYGVVVEKVLAGNFKKVGIKPGFILLTINNVPVRSVSDAHKILGEITSLRNKSEGYDSILFKGFYPNGRMKYYAIDLS